MFCVKCGEELKAEQNFCPSCGHSIENEEKEFPHDMLIRRAHAFSKKYDSSPNILGLSVWEFSKIDEFDPLHKLTYFKHELTHGLMAFSKYEFSQEKIEEIVEEIYPISRKILLSNLKMWFWEQCKTFIDKNDDEFVYHLIEIAKSDIKQIYGLSKYLTIVNCELQDWEGLQSVKTFLKTAEEFYCKNKEIYGRQFVREGRLLHLKEFSEEKRRYDNLLKNINEYIVTFNPALKDEIAQETKENAENQNKIREMNKKSVLIRVICGVLFPFSLILQHLIFSEFNIQYTEFSTFVTMFTAATLCVFVLLANIKIRKTPLVIFLNIISMLSFFPICWIITTLLAWLSKTFMFIAGGFLIFMVLFFHGDRTNP